MSNSVWRNKCRFSRDCYPSLKLEPSFSQHATRNCCLSRNPQALLCQFGTCEDPCLMDWASTGFSASVVLYQNHTVTQYLISPLLTYVQAICLEDLDTHTHMNYRTRKFTNLWSTKLQAGQVKHCWLKAGKLAFSEEKYLLFNFIQIKSYFRRDHWGESKRDTAQVKAFKIIIRN